MTARIPRFRPTVARIDLDALRHNCQLVRRRLTGGGTAVMAAVKADAYGHGLIPVARVMASEGIDWLGVAIVEEGMRLRSAGIDLPILVLGGFADGSEPEAIAAGLTPVVFRSASARALNALAARTGERIGIHIKVDTGMNRLGVPRGLLGSFLELIEGLEHLYVDGLMTHLAEAERTDDEFTAWQFAGFEASIELIFERGHRPRWVHAANSAAMMTGRGSPTDLAATLVRPGLSLYGLAPDPSLEGAWPLRPVMSFETAISYLKRVPVGARLSYGLTWTAERPSKIATLPVGYGDGYARALGNRAEVLVRGCRAPVVGRVCMDLTLIDVTDVPGVQEGDCVVLMGRQGDEEVSAGELAALLGTIPYELVVGISPRVPRVERNA
jgi:alanine racemase